MFNPSSDPAAWARMRAVGRAIRKARGELTQVELGTRLGVPQTTISRWELGRIDFPLEQLRALEVALGLEPAELLAAGGYLPGSEPAGDVLREIRGASFDEAIAAVCAAAALDFGVRLSNRWRLTGGPNGEKVLEWHVTVSEEAPGADD